MSDTPRRLTDGFPDVSYQQWRDLVEAALDGAGFDRRLVSRTAEGLEIEPLYAADGPGAAAAALCDALPRVAGPLGLEHSRLGMETRVSVEAPEPARAAELAAEAIRAGARAISVRIDPWLSALLATPTGDAGWREGGCVAEVAVALEPLEQAIWGAEAALWLEAGGASSVFAAAFVSLARRHGRDPGSLRGGWGDDPLGQLALCGRLAEGLDARTESMVRLAGWTAAHAPGLRSVEVSTLPYAEAGAGPVTEVAVALATGVSYLRALTDAGLDLSQACRQIAFTLGAGRDLFVDLAAIRALRGTWARVVEASGGDPADGAAFVHVRSTRRRRTRRDPWVNMLRATGETLAAAAGGADAATLLPFDAALGEPDAFGRRMARNTQFILEQESHLNHVVDPAAGSWYLESLTGQLAQRAWDVLAEIEREGGMAAALASGRVQRRVREVESKEREWLESRRMAVTGVSTYPLLDEEPVNRPARNGRAREAAAARLSSEAVRAEPDFERLVAGVDQGGRLTDLVLAAPRGLSPTEVEPLVPRSEAEPFESLRDAADALRAQGVEPGVFVAAVGTLAKLKARIDFTANLLAAGGLRVTVPDLPADSPQAAAAAYDASGLPLAAIVATDADYEALLPELAPALKAKGARGIVLAGRPGEREQAFLEAGVDEFAYKGCNAYALLDRLIDRLEVSS